MCDHAAVAGNVLATQVAPLSILNAAVVPLVDDTATNLLLPCTTLLQSEVLGKVASTHVAPLSVEYAALFVPDAVTTHEPAPYATASHVDELGRDPDVAPHVTPPSSESAASSDPDLT